MIEVSEKKCGVSEQISVRKLELLKRRKIGNLFEQPRLSVRDEL